MFPFFHGCVSVSLTITHDSVQAKSQFGVPPTLIANKVTVSVRLSVCLSVPPLLFRRFRRFASDFCITAPAQWHVTDAVVYTALPTRVGRTTMVDKDCYADLGNNITYSYDDICKISGP